QRGSKYFSEIEPFDWEKGAGANNNIINNRIIGLHLGCNYSLFGFFDSRTIVTLTRNYGTYNLGPFGPYKDQAYTLQEISYKVPRKRLVLNASVAYDFGQLTDNVGCMLGFKWNVFNQ